MVSCTIITRLISRTIREKRYSYRYSYDPIALAIARAFAGYSPTSNNTEIFPNCTRKYVMNCTNTCISEDLIKLGREGQFKGSKSLSRRVVSLLLPLP